MKTYGIDLDGVCFDFANAFRVWLNDKLDYQLEEEEITSYYWYETTDVTKEEFFKEFDKFGQEGHGYRHLALLAGAVEGLKQIHEAGHKIYYITNRPGYAHEDTVAALEAAGFPQRENLHFAKGSKASLIKKFGVDVFIDDSPRTIQELVSETDVKMYCRNYKFNEHLDGDGFTRVNNWEEFLAAESFSVEV